MRCAYCLAIMSFIRSALTSGLRKFIGKLFIHIILPSSNLISEASKHGCGPVALCNNFLVGKFL